MRGGFMRKHVLMPPLILGAALTTFNCVSVPPYYGSAQIEPSVSGCGNASISSFSYSSIIDSTLLDYWHIGLRAGFQGEFALNRYLAFYARGGLGPGLTPPEAFLVDGALGVHTSLPLGFITPALLTEITAYGEKLDLSPTFLIGVGRPNEFDWVVLGGRTHFYDFKNLDLKTLPVDVFALVRPSCRWSIFAGLNIQMPIFFTLGVGFHFDTSSFSWI
jgi:hypothetical protein